MASAAATAWTSSGQLVDRLTFVACTGARFKGAVGEAELEIQALKAAMNRTTWITRPPPTAPPWARS